MLPLSEMRSVLSFYADYAASCPDELYMDFVGLMVGTPMKSVMRKLLQ